MEMTSIEYTAFEEYWDDYYAALISMQMYFFMITFPFFIIFHLSIYPPKIQSTFFCATVLIYCPVINFKCINR